MMVTTASQPYACTAKTQFAGRCRNLALAETCRCAAHPLSDFDNIAPPDEVLYKFNLNPRWVERLTQEGIEERQPNFENRIAAHIAQAESVDRGAFVLRGDQKTKSGMEDSGSRVFGPNGLANVDVFQLSQELLIVYNVVDLSIEPMRPGKNQQMKKLVVYHANGEPRQKNQAAIDSLLEFLSSGCWGHCHIFDNPPRKNGLFRSTVNISHREPNKKPAQVVRFNNGLWAVEPITS